MTSGFDIYSGQLVADGIDTTAPLIPFDKTGAITDLRVLDGVMTKIGKMVFKQPKSFIGPIDPIFVKGGMEFGGASEIVSIVDSPPNAKEDGTCVPRGQPDITSQLNVANFAYACDVDIRDSVLRKYVNTSGDLASYISMILGTPTKRISALKYQAQRHLVSNIFDGTRTISSNTKSDESGTAVTYSSGAITGYAGKIEHETYTKTTMTLADVRTFCSKIEDAYDAMKFENDQYTKSGSQDFLASTPNLIIENSLLRTMDRLTTAVTETHPSVEEKASIRLGAIANLIKIDSFDTPPTNELYPTDTIGAVLIDPETFREDMLNADVESERCAKKRLTGYSYRGESILYADRSVPAYAITLGYTEPA